jgi:hypothetical protein
VAPVKRSNAERAPVGTSSLFPSWVLHRSMSLISKELYFPWGAR